jgi:hypothetical protein
LLYPNDFNLCFLKVSCGFLSANDFNLCFLKVSCGFLSANYFNYRVSWRFLAVCYQLTILTCVSWRFLAVSYQLTILTCVSWRFLAVSYQLTIFNLCFLKLFSFLKKNTHTHMQKVQIKSHWFEWSAFCCYYYTHSREESPHVVCLCTYFTNSVCLSVSVWVVVVQCWWGHSGCDDDDEGQFYYPIMRKVY